MATYYPSSSNQRDVLPSPYLSSQKHVSYNESPHLPDNMMYLNQASSTAASYSELLSGSSLTTHNCGEIPSTGGRDEVVVILPTGDHVSTQTMGKYLDMTTGVVVDNHILNGEQNFQYQGLSLSLGIQIQSSIHLPSSQYSYANQGLSYFLSSLVPNSGEHGSLVKELRNAEHLSFDLAGGTHDTVKGGALYNPQCSASPKEMQSVSHLYEASGLACTIFNSKYLKAAQQLLDEVVSVHVALKQPKADKHHNFQKLVPDVSEETDSKFSGRSVLPSMNGMSSDPLESTTNCSGELSPAERQDLQSKMTKLLSVLDEVDTRYKQYHHQMQIVESTFEMVAGFGACKPYTALALQTISRHFRCLRDAISRQIRETHRRLGEEDDTPNTQVLPRLRYVDKQLRQHRTLHQFGITRHSWRPQRGLPERSVSILRAWLFEHFLHPYPKDSEKIILARETGLTRSQVANWFINARVRLWKPMVEDMYKEEFGDTEADCKSSPEHAPKAGRGKSWASDRVEELSTAADGGHMGKFNDSKPDLICNVEMNGCTARLDFQNCVHGDEKIDCWVMNLHGDLRLNVEKGSICPEDIITSNQTGDGSLKATTGAFHDISVLGGFAIDNQVSLAQGLHLFDKDSLPSSGGAQLSGD